MNQWINAIAERGLIAQCLSNYNHMLVGCFSGEKIILRFSLPNHMSYLKSFRYLIHVLAKHSNHTSIQQWTHVSIWVSQSNLKPTCPNKIYDLPPNMVFRVFHHREHQHHSSNCIMRKRGVVLNTLSSSTPKFQSPKTWFYNRNSSLVQPCGITTTYSPAPPIIISLTVSSLA